MFKCQDNSFFINFSGLRSDKVIDRQVRNYQFPCAYFLQETPYKKLSSQIAENLEILIVVK